MGLLTMTADRSSRPRWLILLRPRWLAWHAFAVVAFFGMLWLGDWQLHRAESGNELSWAYTFEWPLFAIFGAYFWVKTLRDELRHAAEAEQHKTDSAGRDGQFGDAATAELNRAQAADPSGREAADSDAYLARLKAEIQNDGRWRTGARGWR